MHKARNLCASDRSKNLGGLRHCCLSPQADTDGSGVIDYTEFLAATLDKKVYVQVGIFWTGVLFDGPATLLPRSFLHPNCSIYVDGMGDN